MEGKLTRNLAIKRNNTMQGVISIEWETRTLILIQQAGPLRCQWKSSRESVFSSPPGRDKQSALSFSLMEWYHKKSIKTETLNKIWNFIIEYPKCPGFNKKKESHIIPRIKEKTSKGMKQYNWLMTTPRWQRDLNSLAKTLKQL